MEKIVKLVDSELQVNTLKQDEGIAEQVEYSKFCEIVKDELETEFVVLMIELVIKRNDTSSLEKQMELLSYHIKQHTRCDDIYTRSKKHTYLLLCYGFDEEMIKSIMSRLQSFTLKTTRLLIMKKIYSNNPSIISKSKAMKKIEEFLKL